MVKNTQIRNIDKYEAIKSLIENYSTSQRYQDLGIVLPTGDSSPRGRAAESLNKRLTQMRYRVQHHMTSKRKQINSEFGIRHKQQRRDSSFEQVAEVKAQKINLKTSKQYSVNQLALTLLMPQSPRRLVVNEQPDGPQQKQFLSDEHLEALKQLDPELEVLLRKYYELGSEIHGEKERFLQQRIIEIAHVVQQRRLNQDLVPTDEPEPKRLDRSELILKSGSMQPASNDDATRTQNTHVH